MTVSKITRLPEPSQIEDSTVSSYLHELIRVIRSNLQILESSSARSTHEITLTPNSTTTLVTDPSVFKDSVILLQAYSASASLATGVYLVNGKGDFTIHHNSTVDTDRIFRYVLVNLNTT